MQFQNWMKCVLIDFECGIVVGARQAALSISKTADILGFSPITISSVYRKLVRRRENIQ